MADKTINNVKIRHRRDTSANWTTNNPVLLSGELIIVDTEAGETRFKIGDGTKTYTQLPFQDEILRNSLSDKVLSEEDREKLDNLTVAVTLDISLVDSNWVGNQYTISDANIKSDSVIDLTPSIGISQLELESLQLASIVGGEQVDGSLTLVAMGEVPTVSIPVTLIIGGGEGESNLDMSNFVTASAMEVALSNYVTSDQMNTAIDNAIMNSISVALAGDY